MFTTDDVLAKLGLQARASAGDYLFPMLGIFSAGVLVGAGVALMLAPKSGSEIRGDIGRKAMDLKQKAMGLKDKVRRVMPGNGHGARAEYDDLESLSRQELYDRAAEMNIERRAEMTKPELIDAIRSS